MELILSVCEPIKMQAWIFDGEFHNVKVVDPDAESPLFVYRDVSSLSSGPVFAQALPNIQTANDDNL